MVLLLVMCELSKDEKQIIIHIIRSKIMISSGTVFEDLFSTIMREGNLDFRQVKPQGKFGDKKNDGFISSTGEYFQVYSPEEPEDKKHKSGAKKALDDFKGLHEYWNDLYKVRVYNFVINDKYRGTYPEVHKSLANITKDFKIKTRLFDAKKLEDSFLGLSRSKIEGIIGGLPDPSNISLDYSVLNDVVEYLIRKDSHTSKVDKLRVPDFDEKIKFNNLSDYVARMLNNASLSLYQLEEYFDTYGSKNVRDILKIEFVEMYKKYSQNDLSDDDIFIRILETVSNSTGKVNSKKKYIRESVLVLMAYYFESCDIFKEPVIV